VSSVAKTLRRVAVLCVLPCLLFALPVGAASAREAGGIACWKSLLNEWYGGSISTVYKINCYQQAIDHLPPDVSVYSSARSDILAAESRARHDKTSPHIGLTQAQTTTTGTTSTTATTGRKKKGGLIGILDDLTPGNPQAFPLPLLVLGALAILLVIAGGAGMIWQRRHPTDADTA
jgi:hypothetical protein